MITAKLTQAPIRAKTRRERQRSFIAWMLRTVQHRKSDCHHALMDAMDRIQ